MKECVIVLHGLGLNRLWMWPLAVFLRRRGFEVINVGYPSTRRPIDDLVREHILPIAREKSAQAERLHFVGHSLGGILIRRLVQNHGFQISGRAVFLGTPSHGSEVADFLKNLFLFRLIFGPAGQQLGTKNNSLLESLPPPAFDLGVIAGNHHWLHFPVGLFMPKPNDGLVTVASTKVDRMKDHITLGTDHSLMVMDPRVMKQTGYFLQQGSFLK